MGEILAPAMVSISAGEWSIGSDDGLDDEGPVRSIVLAAFRVARRPVSNAEYQRFVERAQGIDRPFSRDERFADPDQPAVGVSWFDAVAYLEWLSAELGVAFRLPSEAEREVAARGGLEGQPWPWGSEPPERRSGLEELVVLDRPHVPGAACANALALSCMADNVHEWCSDWYSAELEVRTAAENPEGPRWRERRASRGGSWRHRVKFTRVSARSSLPPDRRYNDYGFRVFATAE